MLTAIGRGLRLRCPKCGKAPLFYRYLKVYHECGTCGLDLHQYPSDDGPAYFTILLVGHLVVAPLLLFSFILTAPVGVVLAAVLIPLIGFTLLILPRIKGAVIGVLFTLKVRREDAHLHTAESAN